MGGVLTTLLYSGSLGIERRPWPSSPVPSVPAPSPSFAQTHSALFQGPDRSIQKRATSIPCAAQTTVIPLPGICLRLSGRHSGSNCPCFPPAPLADCAQPQGIFLWVQSDASGLPIPSGCFLCPGEAEKWGYQDHETWVKHLGLPLTHILKASV